MSGPRGRRRARLRHEATPLEDQRCWFGAPGVPGLDCAGAASARRSIARPSGCAGRRAASRRGGGGGATGMPCPGAGSRAGTRRAAPRGAGPAQARSRLARGAFHPRYRCVGQHRERGGERRTVWCGRSTRGAVATRRGRGKGKGKGKGEQPGRGTGTDGNGSFNGRRPGSIPRSPSQGPTHTPARGREGAGGQVRRPTSSCAWASSATGGSARSALMTRPATSDTPPTR